MCLVSLDMTQAISGVIVISQFSVRRDLAVRYVAISVNTFYFHLFGLNSKLAKISVLAGDVTYAGPRKT